MTITFINTTFSELLILKIIIISAYCVGTKTVKMRSIFEEVQLKLMH
jgi:hypothetical protein